MNNIIDEEGQHIIYMYIVARQFKRAIDITEMLILPDTKENLLKVNTLDNGNLTFTVRGNERIDKFYPFVVNKAFSVEVLLKTIMEINHIEIPKGPDGHNLFLLYNLVIEKINLYEQLNVKKISLSNKEMTEMIKKNYNVFVDWRYIYEKTDKCKFVNFGFLNWFCDELDRYLIKIIKEKYNYDVEKDLR